MVEWVIDIQTVYRTLKENATAMGVDQKVTQRAIELQKVIGEDNCPWEDAYEMAWNELMGEQRW